MSQYARLLVGYIMLEFEVTDIGDFRRAKNAQYTGTYKALNLAGQTLVGMVTSVTRLQAEGSWRWIVKVRPSPQRETSQVRPIR